MDNIVKLKLAERGELFSETASRMGLVPAFIEKDFWVCYILDKLFSADQLKDKIIFKGGTSLSKVFGLIKRFSEDIDLILDWRVLTEDDPNLVRSKKKQKEFIEELRLKTSNYLKTIMAPVLQDVLGNNGEVTVDAESRIINIKYPAEYKNEYVSSVICLEIGPIASWIPNDEYAIKSFVENYFPDQFSGKEIKVKAITAERTFWEKITILHHEAHRPVDSKIPLRYSRHYYDIVMMSKHTVKERAYEDLGLLSEVVKFKNKFYPRTWAMYDLAKPGTMKLYPPQHCIEILRKDYKAMEEMIFDKIPPTFDELMLEIKTMETEINELPGK